MMESVLAGVVVLKFMVKKIIFWFGLFLVMLIVLRGEYRIWMFVLLVLVFSKFFLEFGMCSILLKE